MSTLQGQAKVIKNRQEKLGQVFYNKFGSKMEVVEYKNKAEVTVKFEDGYIVTGEFSNIKNGNISNPYDKSVYGVGYLGEGINNLYENTNTLKAYESWRGMMRRCYSTIYQEKQPTYIGCTVAPEWHNYQIFTKWYDENYYEANGEVMNLDKDILVKGNKVYSPETCVFAPKSINKLFIKRNLEKASLPLGITYVKDMKQFRARCHKFDLGLFNTPEEAFVKYKICKENIIKQIAEEYKKYIPLKLYSAMYNFSVNITD